MKLTKKEISENIRVTRRNGFNSGFDYNAKIRGFYFETLRDQDCGHLVEVDETGHCTSLAVYGLKGKKEIVNSIFEWFKHYAPQHFE